jgi:hypothetical protein
MLKVGVPVDSWNFERAIAKVKTLRIEKFFISLKNY